MALLMRESSISDARARREGMLDDDERAALMNALDEGIAAARNGQHSDADDFVRDLLVER